MNYREMTEQSREMFIALLTERLKPWINCRMLELNLIEYRTIYLTINSNKVDWSLINDLNHIINAFDVMADIRQADNSSKKMIITIY